MSENISKNQPWNDGVKGTQVLPIINLDDKTIRVEAGPGTGKTFGLVRRVQRILHPNGLNVPGDQVLVVAFNRVIAKQLKQDIDKCLANSPHSGKPVIKTIHALCLEIIGEDTRILLPHEEEAMLYDILCEYPSFQETYPTYKKAEQALRDHEAKHIEDMKLWQAIQRWNLRHRSQLISELPSLLLEKIHGGDFGDKQYKHVIVDEFQDLTPGEQELFLKIRDTSGSFLALGDPRQSIYSFRGNDREGLYKIDDRLGDSGGKVTHLEMTECQRCPKEVVHAANELMSLSTSAPMVPGSDVVANTHVVVWKSLTAESEGMARAIVNNIEKNPNDDHLAMVTRRFLGYRLREEIAKLNPELEVDLSFSEGLLETWPVREAFLFFCLLADPDAATWRSWLGYKTSRDGKDFKVSKRNADAYLKLFAESKDNINEELIKQIASSDKSPKGTGGSVVKDRAKRFVALKEELKWDKSDPMALFDEIFDIGKWADASCSDIDTAKLDMDLIRSKAILLCQEAQLENPELSAADILKQVAQTMRYQIATRELSSEDDSCRLRVTTLWGAKGVTAHHVYVIGLCAESIPGIKGDEYHGTDLDFHDEQRRLFYVSMTRSKKTLVLSRANSITTGQARQLGLDVTKGNGFRATLQMSPFLRDIKSCLPLAVKGENWAGVSDG